MTTAIGTFTEYFTLSALSDGFPKCLVKILALYATVPYSTFCLKYLETVITNYSRMAKYNGQDIVLLRNVAETAEKK